VCCSRQSKICPYTPPFIGNLFIQACFDMEANARPFCIFVNQMQYLTIVKMKWV
jgi:hypothetical protein